MVTVVNLLLLLLFFFYLHSMNSVVAAGAWQELGRVREVVPGDVAEDAVFDVAAEHALL